MIRQMPWPLTDYKPALDYLLYKYTYISCTHPQKKMYVINHVRNKIPMEVLLISAFAARWTTHA